MNPAGLPTPPGTPPPWLAVARRYEGLKEIPGPKNNPTIMEFAARLGSWFKKFYTNEGIPWCGLFVAGVFREALPGLKLPANPLGAANWAAWGVPLSTPALGAVLVFKRPGGAHVGFYEGEDATRYLVRGGNQGNAVSVIPIEKNRLVKNGIRWPKGQPLPPLGPVLLVINRAASKNEA